MKYISVCVISSALWQFIPLGRVFVYKPTLDLAAFCRARIVYYGVNNSTLFGPILSHLIFSPHADILFKTVFNIIFSVYFKVSR
jgi:hypothetical protein